jgi:hypothetical protein
MGRMLRRSVVGFAVAVAVLAVAGGPADARAARCAVAHSRTLAADAQVRVFSVFSHAAGVRRVYGCAYAAGRRWQLGDEADPSQFDDPQVRALQLSGTLAAYATETDEPQTVQSIVAVRDLRTGRYRVSTSAADPDEARAFVTALVLGVGAQVSWIADLASDPANQVFEVRTAAPKAAPVVLDHAADIDPSSLALSASGTVLYWLRGGVAMSAHL